MHVKIFDCDIFIDSHEVRVKDKYGITSRSYESKVLPTYTIKDVVEEHLVPNIYIRRYLEELLKTQINPNRVS